MINVPGRMNIIVHNKYYMITFQRVSIAQNGWRTSQLSDSIFGPDEMGIR